MCQGHRVAGGHAAAGLVLHSEDHTKQAVVISGEPYHGVEGWYPALVFDIPSRQRIYDSGSSVNIHHKWHVAENYVLGMDAPLPVPTEAKLKPRICTCSSDLCDGFCPNELTNPHYELCDTCSNHGYCTCGCGCEDQTFESGNRCVDCDVAPLCTNCVSSHDIWEGDYCRDCWEDIHREEDESAEA